RPRATRGPYSSSAASSTSISASPAGSTVKCLSASRLPPRRRPRPRCPPGQTRRFSRPDPLQTNRPTEALHGTAQLRPLRIHVALTMSARRRKDSAPAPGETQTSVSMAVLGQTLAGAVDGAFAIAPDGRVVIWNWMAEKILGWTAKDMIGRLAEEALAGGREQWRNWHGIGDAIERFEMEAQTKSGQSIWLDVGVLELPTSDCIALRVYVFRDGSTTKALLDAIQSLCAPASAAGARSSLTKREIEVLRLMTTR